MENLGFCCPVCSRPLIRLGHGAGCNNGHSFDMTRQGYIHLLPSNRMHSKLPGDSREMVEGRRRFLEAGYYEPFQTELCAIVKRLAGELEAPVIGDAGCGEGYYTGAVKRAAPLSRVYGFDISKLAVRAAAGKYKDVGFAVASSFSIPFTDGFCHLLIDVFAPIAQEEFARVIKPGGYFIYAVPGERHLFGMKEILYEHPYENQLKDTSYPGFRFISRSRVASTINIPDEKTAMDLFSMTPYYWKTDVAGVRRLREAEGFSTEIEFDFLVYHRI